MITDAVKNAYQSKRLRYIRIKEHDPKVRDFVSDLLSDPEVFAQTSTMMLRPIGKSELDYLMSVYSNALLGVIICLLPPEPPAAKGGKDSAETTSEDVMIGNIIVGEGGIPGSIAHNRNTSVGLALSSAYQGKGYGREALNWAMDWAFRHAAMHTVSISTSSFNTRAAKLYRDMGFIDEGRRREVVWFDRQWHDELLFSLTEEEWDAARNTKRVSGPE